MLPVGSPALSALAQFNWLLTSGQLARSGALGVKPQAPSQRIDSGLGPENRVPGQSRGKETAERATNALFTSPRWPEQPATQAS